MGKICLNKLSGNITVGCTIPMVGVQDLYLMHAEDVTLTYSGAQVSGVAFAAGSTAILVEGYKQNIQVTTAIRSMDAASKLDITVAFKVSGRGTEECMRVNSLLMGKFYVAAEYPDGTNTFMGVQAPLECSGIDWDSNANAGLMTVTLAAPEGSAGNQLMRASTAALGQIKAKVGV